MGLTEEEIREAKEEQKEIQIKTKKKNCKESRTGTRLFGAWIGVDDVQNRFRRFLENAS